MIKFIRFFKNVWYFRKELYNHIGCNGIYSLNIFNKSLKMISKSLKTDLGDSFVNKKTIERIDEAIYLIDKLYDDDYVNIVLLEMEEDFKESEAYKEETSFSRSNLILNDVLKNKNSDYYDIFYRANELNEKDWKRLWTILKSKDYGIRSWWA